MAVTTSPMVSLDDVKATLPIRAGNVDHDVRLLSMIKVATAQIENATKRSFTYQAHTEFFNAIQNTGRVLDLNGSDTYGVQSFRDMGTVRDIREQILTLTGFPVDLGQTVAVRYDRVRSFATLDTVIDPSSYEVDDDIGRMFLRYPTSRSFNTIRVSYTAGFAPSVAPLTSTFWDAAKKEAAVVLSNGELTATTTAAISQVQSIVGVPTGKWQWNFVVGDNTGVVDLGISNLGGVANFSTRVGSTSGGWAYESATGNKFNGGVSTAYGDAYVATDTITVWLDLDNDAIWFGKNGVPQGGATLAEIIAGDTTNAAFTNVAGTIYAAMSDTAAGVSVVTANFGTVGITPTTGFTAGLGTLDTASENLSASLPDDLKLACVIQTAFLFKKLDPENLGAKTDKKQGGPNIDFLKAAGLTPEAASLLTKYKKLLRGST